MNVDHVRLLVIKFTECFRFYRDILGLKVHWGNEEGSYASFSDPGGNEVCLAIFSRQSMAEVLGTTNLPVEASSQDRSMRIVNVKDVDAMAERLQTQGIPLVLGPRDFPDWGIRSAYLRDPDGNLVELGSGLPPERWSSGLQEADRQYKQQVS